MPALHFNDSKDKTHHVELCQPCYEGIRMQIKEFSVCETCEAKMRAAGMPMRQPKGHCDGCGRNALLTHEFAYLMYCKQCAANAAAILGVPLPA